MAFPDAVAAAIAFRERLLSREATTAGHLARAYRRLYDAINVEIDAMLDLVWDEEERKYRRKLGRRRLEALRRQVADEMRAYGIIAANELDEGALDAIQQAINNCPAGGVVKLGGLRSPQRPRHQVAAKATESPVSADKTTTRGTEIGSSSARRTFSRKQAR